MNFDFTENTVINIPLTYKGYRLEEGEKVRFRCCFKNYEGDFPYTLDLEEDNKGEAGSDGKFTVTLDMSRYSISPGRYSFDLSLVLESGSLITIKTKAECHINVISAEEGLDKPNGEVFFGADFIVEEGKTGSWHYRKWNSGKMEAWGKQTVTIDAKVTEYSPLVGLGGYLPKPPGMITIESVLGNPCTSWSEIGAKLKPPVTGATIETHIYGLATSYFNSKNIGDTFDIDVFVVGIFK